MRIIHYLSHFRNHVLVLLIAAGLLAGLAGCSQPYRTDERLERGLVIVLTGVEGRSVFNDNIVRGLDEGGVDWAIELHDWTLPFSPLLNLWAESRNRRTAESIARRISRYRWTYPDRPVVLVGQSGGAAMAVWTAEALLPAQKVDGLILLAAALSPKYHLDFALEHSRRGIVNLYSERDLLFLGVATTMYGTMDGEHTDSAGRVGFAIPGGDVKRTRLYEKVLQIGWRPEMSSSGNMGSHLTSGSADYVSKYVAPFVLAEKWDDALHERMIQGRGIDLPASKPAEAEKTPAIQPVKVDQTPETQPVEPVKTPASQPAACQPVSCDGSIVFEMVCGEGRVDQS